MTRFLLTACLLLGGAALAGGVVHLVKVDERGDVRFAPRVDQAALDYWTSRAKSLAAQATTHAGAVHWAEHCSEHGSGAAATR